MAIIQKSENVFALNESLDVVNRSVISDLKIAADASSLKRARLCLHRSNDEPVHEMLIVLSGEVFIRPHRHLTKSESFHLLEGKVTAVFFDDNGVPSRGLRLGTEPGESFIYRVSDPVYHTQLVWSRHLVFYECTSGPFLKEETEFAPWAPEEASPEAQAYLENLKSQFE